MSRAKAVSLQKSDTRKMEEETRLMEAKLEMLRKTVDPNARPASGSGSSRWKSGSAGKPLTKGYVKNVLDQTPQQRRSRGAATAASSPPPAEEQAARPPPTPTRSALAVGAQAAPSSEAQEVQAFLTDLKLDRYAGLFMEHGFDCMDVVMDMEESHMREIGMAAGHILKLQQRLDSLRAPPAVASASAGAGAAAAAAAAAAPSPAMRLRTPQALTGSAGGRLGEGEYSEEASAASFQEALQAWRSTDSKAAPAKPGAFWSSVGERDVDLSRISTPARVVTELVADPSQEPAAIVDAPAEEKLCCYQCYKQFFAKHSVERCWDDTGDPAKTRQLCSDTCADRWTESMLRQAEAQRKRREKLEIAEDMRLDLQQAEALGEAAGAAA
eukprot:TRINITY_DN55830_c0_g1_i1.p1 TRINITY_DN55830_c0_g1~~TRINITY_DN55830_c0_g1_i1.p1  ORF type:complete len:384 (+),score=107.80 TRINITY_DN55830_c0_g1_i1:146-1297(+)